MTRVPLLDELAVVAAVAVVVTVALARLRLPTVAGLLAAGALVGPAGLGLVRSVAAIEALAEIGVVLLLFSIGLEFSLARLRDVFRQVALGGGVQVGLTTLVVAGIASLLGEPGGRSVFYGFVFALSSTAIVLRALAERRELDAPHGRFIVGTLVLQDLCVVPMVLVVPTLGVGAASGGTGAVVGALARAALVVAGTVLVARGVVPRLLGWVDASRSREVFLLAILGLCIGTAWLTSLAGLSLALGAFLGGLVVADTEYSHRAMGDVLPLRDAFVSLFFVSLGMLFDVRAVADHPLLVAGLLAGFIAVKGVLATVAALAMRFPARVASLAGVGLAQFGEFGFVLARLGEESGVVEADAVSPLLAAGIGSMFLTPLLVRAAPHLTAGERLLAPLERLIGVRGIDELPARALPAGHVVLVGFGVGGRIIAEVLRKAERPFVVLELNAGNVRAAKREGHPVYYADATSEEALGHARVREASLLVLLINDPAAAERVVSTVRRVAPELPVLMRSRYLAEREPLLALGASDVVAEEVEGAVEVVARTLRWLEQPRQVIDERIREVRQATRTSERSHPVARSGLSDLRGLGDVKVELLAVRAGSRAAGASPASLELRARTGALVVAVRRGTARLEEVDPGAPFTEGDVAVVVGAVDAVARARALFEPER